MPYRLQHIFAQIVCICFAIIVLGATLGVAPLRSPQVELVSTPFEVATLDRRIFPLDLLCDAIDGLAPGPSWQDIEVGSSSLNNLKSTLAELSELYQLVGDYETEETVHTSGIRFIWNAGPYPLQNGKEAIPDSVGACLIDDRISALRVSVNPFTLFLPDLVALYGAPDVVTWSHSSPTGHTAFWFEQGIAADVATIDEEPATYGAVLQIIYFPYQPVAGYETRWPFNKTRSPSYPKVFEGSFEEFVQYYGPQNPFDFPVMLATITAQPSRTPTPTFTPRPLQTATPTPELDK